jgi:hypothetical protein
MRVLVKDLFIESTVEVSSKEINDLPIIIDNHTHTLLTIFKSKSELTNFDIKEYNNILAKLNSKELHQLGLELVSLNIDSPDVVFPPKYILGRINEE